MGLSVSGINPRRSSTYTYTHTHTYTYSGVVYFHPCPLCDCIRVRILVMAVIETTKVNIEKWSATVSSAVGQKQFVIRARLVRTEFYEKWRPCSFENNRTTILWTLRTIYVYLYIARYARWRVLIGRAHGSLSTLTPTHPHPSVSVVFNVFVSFEWLASCFDHLHERLGIQTTRFGSSHSRALKCSRFTTYF